MKEKIIIKSEHCDMTKIKLIVYGIPGSFLVWGLLLYIFNFDQSRKSLFSERSIWDNMLDPFDRAPGFLIDLGLIVGIISVVIGLLLKSHSMTVTNKRICGSTFWGNRVDLPVDSVSAVATNIFKGIAVGTSSGKIAFNFIKNREDIYSKITELIIQRQSAGNTEKPIETKTNTADEL